MATISFWRKLGLVRPSDQTPIIRKIKLKQELGKSLLRLSNFRKRLFAVNRCASQEKCDECAGLPVETHSKAAQNGSTAELNSSGHSERFMLH